jgi:hypothetical protein
MCLLLAIRENRGVLFVCNYGTDTNVIMAILVRR